MEDAAASERPTALATERYTIDDVSLLAYQPAAILFKAASIARVVITASLNNIASI